MSITLEGRAPSRPEGGGHGADGAAPSKAGTAERTTAVVIVNPRAHTGAGAAGAEMALAALRERACVRTELATDADGGHVAAVITALRETRPEVAVAAGGDGTVRDVAEAILNAGIAPAPALGIIPLGTGNNVARSLGLTSCRYGDAAALARAVAAITAGHERAIDVGRVGTQYFVGSFALGMDADILHTRNRVRARLGLGGRIGGYPLYLWSCALNVLRPHAVIAELDVDGQRFRQRVYNLLVTNTPLYAGEFRFDADNSADDGRLDLQIFGNASHYLRCYPGAWRRHVRYQRGEAVRPAAELRRVRTVRIELPKPVPYQLDGEEAEASGSLEIAVMPQALRVRSNLG